MCEWPQKGSTSPGSLCCSVIRTEGAAHANEKYNLQSAPVDIPILAAIYIHLITTPTNNIEGAMELWSYDSIAKVVRIELTHVN